MDCNHRLELLVGNMGFQSFRIVRATPAASATGAPDSCHPVDDEAGPDLREEERGLLGHALAFHREIPYRLQAGVVEHYGGIELLGIHLLEDAVDLGVVRDVRLALIGFEDAVEDLLLHHIGVEGGEDVVGRSVGVCEQALAGLEHDAHHVLGELLEHLLPGDLLGPQRGFDALHGVLLRDVLGFHEPVGGPDDEPFVIRGDQRRQDVLLLRVVRVLEGVVEGGLVPVVAVRDEHPR